MENLINHKQTTLKFWTTYSFRILVIDDEPSWQAILSHSLHQCRDNDIEIRFVRSAKQAMDLLYREKKFDLIISDHFIDGDMTGYELWSYCKSQFLNVPFILISGKKKAKFNELKSESDPNLPLIIQKPFNPQSFKSVINLYLSR